VRAITAEIAVAGDNAKRIVLGRLWALGQSDFVYIYFIELPVVFEKVPDTQRFNGQLLNDKLLRTSNCHERADEEKKCAW
jgi:hypothetical protein